jgi:cyclopropane-fatty-acyl-phospholipid synthase
MNIVELLDISPHYAQTLAKWRRNFWNNINSVRELGFTESFIRTWHYYLCYCEAGFAERQVGVAQIILAGGSNRSGALASQAS